MDVLPALSAEAIRRRLLELLERCEAFSWASAWVSKNEVFDAALRARRKMDFLVIGTDQYFTDPECLDDCADIEEARVVPPGGSGMFHPKVYAFDLGQTVEIYVGSANLTNGGLRRNTECGVFLKAERENPELRRLLKFIEALWDKAEPIDSDFIESYRANKRRVADAQEDLRRFVPVRRPKRKARVAHDIDPNLMDWPAFVKRVKADRTHGFEPRLKVLSEARRIFASGLSFDSFSRDDQKRIAGLVGPKERKVIDWGYFGQMTAFGKFHAALDHDHKKFSLALDQIPLQGPIRKRHFIEYLKNFYSIEGAGHGWIGMGTRLLAMKRPDYFVCVDNPNRRGLCDYFGVAFSTLDLSSYWSKIVEPMMGMPWWQAEWPAHPEEQAIWEGRAAFLDALYYDPDA